MRGVGSNPYIYSRGANLGELDSSGLSSQNKTDIKKYIEEGNYVTVSAEEVTVDSWTGTGYIVYDPASGMSTYMFLVLLEIHQ